MLNEIKVNEEVEKKKRGRRKKNEKVEYELNKEQVKFFVDLKNEKKELSKVQEFLIKCNDKSDGSEITFKDIAVYAIQKLTDKDIDKLKEYSLTEMEKVERALNEYNDKNGFNLTLGEFLLKKLNIN